MRGETEIQRDRGRLRGETEIQRDRDIELEGRDRER